MDNKEIVDIIKAAEKYLKKLQNLNKNIDIAEKQIINSGNESINKIEAVFTKLTETVIKTLNNRKQKLINNIKKVQDEGLTPLIECKHIISDKINLTNNLILDGNSLLNSSFSPIKKDDFYLKSNLLGNLPAVPSLNEVPYINFTSSKNVQQEIADACSNFGTIFFQSPVNIHTVIPKPGGILVQWEENDVFEDHLCIREFQLQYAFGDVLENPQLPIQFQHCYIGPNTEYLKRDLKLNERYSFRVCCKIEDSLSSPWSLPQVAQTIIEPFHWSKNQNCFSLNNDDKLATKIISEPAILISNGAQFLPTYSIEFTILEMDSSHCTYIGLCDQDDINLLSNQMQNINTFQVAVDGSVYIKQELKSTKLPPLNKDNKISFTCEEINDKIRICVENDEKTVTYDWKISNNEGLYFFVKSDSPHFKILVE